MGPLVAGDDARNDVTNKGSSMTGTTGNAIRPWHNERLLDRHVHRPSHFSQGSQIGNKRTLGTIACVWGRLVEFTKLREISDRLTGAYTSLKFNTSELCSGNTKFYGQFWQLGRLFDFSYMHTQYKITT